MQLLSFPGLGGSQPHRGCVHKLGAEPCPRETCWALTHPEGRDGGKTWSSGHRHTPGERPQEEPACPHRLSDVQPPGPEVKGSIKLPPPAVLGDTA